MSKDVSRSDGLMGEEENEHRIVTNADSAEKEGPRGRNRRGSILAIRISGKGKGGDGNAEKKFSVHIIFRDVSMAGAF